MREGTQAPFGGYQGSFVSSVVAGGTVRVHSHTESLTMAAKTKSSPTLDLTRLMDMPLQTLEGMKATGLYVGTADEKVIEFAIAHHQAKPAAPVAAAPAPVAQPKAPPAPPKAYVQRVEVFRGRARIKGGICKDQLRNVIAQLQALESNPAVLTYAECQVQFPWDKSQG